MKPVDRRSGYWNRERETMSPNARERYQTTWLAALSRARAKEFSLHR
jgi:hypothetical protein